MRCVHPKTGAALRRSGYLAEACGAAEPTSWAKPTSTPRKSSGRWPASSARNGSIGEGVYAMFSTEIVEHCKASQFIDR